MKEMPFFIEGGGERLFAVLHRPEGPARRGFVFCHPFAEEKLWAHRIYVSFARELAARGIAVLRFDERGHGDSEGVFVESSIDTRLEDTARAISALREQEPGLERIGLLGLRFGATLAWLAAQRFPEVRDLVLWEPVTDGAKFMQEQLMRNLSTQLKTYGEVRVKREQLVAQMQSGQAVNSDGYELGWPLFEQVNALRLPGGTAPDCNCLVVQIDPITGKEPRPDLLELTSACSSARLEQVEEQPFWREVKKYYGRAETLYERTLKWMEECA